MLDTVINFFKEKLERIIVCLYDKNCFSSLFKLTHVPYSLSVLNHIVKDFKFPIIISSSLTDKGLQTFSQNKCYDRPSIINIIHYHNLLMFLQANYHISSIWHPMLMRHTGK